MKKKVCVIGAEIDLGAHFRGVKMGPDAIRHTHLFNELKELGYETEDLGNLTSDSPKEVGADNLKYYDDVLKFSRRLARKVSDVMKADAFPIVLGGDHSVGIGAVAGASDEKIPTGAIFFDAHPDFNTPESTMTGNIHGMGTAISVGKGEKSLVNIQGFSPKLSERNTVLIGIRDIDPEERKLVAASQLTVFTMSRIDRMGIDTVMEQAIRIASDGMERVHISFDMDVIDPREAPAVGYSINGGLTFREARLAMEMLNESGIVTSLDLSEINTTLDIQNKTAIIAAELLCFLFGKKY
jgi:arginase